MSAVLITFGSRKIPLKIIVRTPPSIMKHWNTSVQITLLMPPIAVYTDTMNPITPMDIHSGMPVLV